MKNVLFIVIDSLMASRVFCRSEHASTTPYLDSIKDNCFVDLNIFSQGPFTEAGTRGLLCGTDTLDDGGYFFRYDGSKTFISTEFKKSGYETTSLIYPTCLYSKNILESLDRVYYSAGMLFHVFWDQKYYLYKQVLEKYGFLDAQDMSDMVRLTDIILFAWLAYLNPDDMQGKEMLIPYLNGFDFKTHYEIISREYNRFRMNNKDYVLDLLRKGKAHVLNNMPKDFMDNIIRNDSITTAFNANVGFAKKLKQKQRSLNFRNNKPDKYALTRGLARLKNGMTKYTFGEYAYWIENMARGNDIRTCMEDHSYKLLLSARTQIDFATNLLIGNRSNRPQFIMTHVEEPHYFTTYFTYDSDNAEMISEELRYAEEYVNSIKKGYKGLISYDLAVRYVDNVIKGAVESLKKAGVLDNTVVVLTADHGSSYNFDPPRGRSVNNCHTENYQIPLIIYDEGSKGRTTGNLGMGKDVIPTILGYLQLPVSGGVSGKSLLGGEVNDYVTTEYMGAGCPDMRRNEANIVIRNNKYLIFYTGKLTEEFKGTNIKEIYDLVRDPREINNIHTQRNDEIEWLIKKLKDRFTQIQENNKSWLSHSLDEAYRA